MLFKDIKILDENFSIREGVNVRIEKDRITYIGEELPGDYEGTGSESEEVVDGKDRLLMPGFFNAHAHSPMCLMRGYGENLTLQNWLFDRIFPFEDKLTPEAVYWGTFLSMAESLKYGIVSTSDMYYFTDDMVRAVLDSGAKANISRALANPEGRPFNDLPSVGEMKTAVRDHQNDGDGRIIIESSLHAEYTSDEKTAIALSELTEELGLRMHVHVSETLSEHEECKERHNGRTPVRYLSDCGIFNGPSLAAHCVWVEEEDRDILRDKGVFVATNPVSNLKLASGICDVKALMDKGITVAMGTDSVASNNNLSMFEEMKTMSLIAKVKNNDPRVVTPREALMMATVNGARAQGREDTGVIREGNKADLLVIRTDSPNMNPVHNLLNNLVLSATDSDIEMTMVDGNILYRNGEFITIDMEETVYQVEKAVKDIKHRLGGVSGE